MSILRIISSLPFRSTASASLAVLLLSFSTTAVAADEKPVNAAELFDYARLWDVRIHISEDSFRGLEPKQVRGFDRDFPYVEATVEIAGHPSLKVALRYKGNSSYSSARDTKKKSFKVDFNRIIEKQKFLGLTKLNLNNNILDPSQVRETLAYRMFNNLGLPSCRTAFAKVYLEIEGRSGAEYLGLYTMVEQVNGSFLQERFGTRTGCFSSPSEATPSCMRAPPESLSPIIGAPTFIACSMILQIFRAWAAESAPPNTVKSCENANTMRPLTVP